MSSNSADGVHTFSLCEMRLCKRIQVIATAQEYYEDAGCARPAKYLEGENSNLVALARTETHAAHACSNKYVALETVWTCSIPECVVTR